MTPIEEVELKVLGALLDAGGTIDAPAAALLDLAGLVPEDFTGPRVRAAWSMAARLVAKGRPVDAFSLYAAGQATRDFVAGDAQWLASLQMTHGCTREMFGLYAAEVRDHSRRRGLLGELRRHVQQLEAGATRAVDVAESMTPYLQGLSTNLETTGTGSEDVLELSEMWESQEQRKSKPLIVPTGIPSVDEAIGGFPPNLSIVCGLPSVGKSAALASMMDAQLELGLRVGLVGLEDGSRWFAKRLFARDLGIPLRDVGAKRRTGDVEARFPDVASALSGKLGRLATYRQSTINAAELVRLLSHWFLNLGIDVAYVDHGGEVDHSAHTKIDDHRLRVAQTYGMVRDLAVRLQRPVVVLAHTNRASDDEVERPPRKSELAESAWIERRARLMIGCWSKASEPEFMRATIIKNTEGKPGDTFKIKRIVTAALLDPNGAELVNLESEKRDEARARREEKEAARLEAAEIRERQKAAAAAAKKPKQVSFVDSP